MRISDWSSDVCSSDLHGWRRRAVGEITKLAASSIPSAERGAIGRHILRPVLQRRAPFRGGPGAAGARCPPPPPPAGPLRRRRASATAEARRKGKGRRPRRGTRRQCGGRGRRGFDQIGHEAGRGKGWWLSVTRVGGGDEKKKKKKKQ